MIQLPTTRQEKSNIIIPRKRVIVATTKKRAVTTHLRRSHGVVKRGRNKKNAFIENQNKRKQLLMTEVAKKHKSLENKNSTMNLIDRGKVKQGQIDYVFGEEVTTVKDLYIFINPMPITYGALLMGFEAITSVESTATGEKVILSPEGYAALSNHDRFFKINKDAAAWRDRASGHMQELYDSTDMIFIPVRQLNHWFGIIIYSTKEGDRRTDLINSYIGENSWLLVMRSMLIIEWFTKIIFDMKSTKYVKQTSSHSNKEKNKKLINTIKGIQTDRYSCGIHILDGLLQKMRNKAVDYIGKSDKQMTIWRSNLIASRYEDIKWIPENDILRPLEAEE